MENKKQLYNMQKFLILKMKLNPETTYYISDAYVYAWANDLYPYFHSNKPASSFEEGYDECFEISEEKITEILEFLDSEWIKGKCYTFYELEDHYNESIKNKEIDRMDLIHILRYTYLTNRFDKKFWDKLLEGSDYPAEAEEITDKFDSKEIFIN